MGTRALLPVLALLRRQGHAHSQQPRPAILMHTSSTKKRGVVLPKCCECGHGVCERLILVSMHVCFRRGKQANRPRIASCHMAGCRTCLVHEIRIDGGQHK